MSSQRRRSSSRYSAPSRTAQQNGRRAPAAEPPAGAPVELHSARDLLSQALDECDPHEQSDHERFGQPLQNSHANQQHSLAAQLGGLSVKIEPEDLSDGDSPRPKVKRFKPARRTKKRAQAEQAAATAESSSYTLKLFDRTVDLGKFEENAPLYALCRAWVRNPTLSGAPAAEDPAGAANGPDEEGDLHELPAPHASSVDLRLPADLRKPSCTAEEIDLAINSCQQEAPDLLMEENCARWRRVRRDWVHAAKLNDARYKQSADLLKAMYERTIATQSSEMEA